MISFVPVVWMNENFLWDCVFVITLEYLFITLVTTLDTSILSYVGLLFAKFDASTHYESDEGGYRLYPYVLCIYQMPGINRIKVYIWNTEIYLKVYTFMQIIYYITNKLSLQPKYQTLKIWDSVSLFLSYWAIREFFLQRQQKV